MREFIEKYRSESKKTKGAKVKIGKKDKLILRANPKKEEWKKNLFHHFHRGNLNRKRKM